MTFLQPVGGRRLGLAYIHAVQKAAVDGRSVAEVCVAREVVGRLDGPDDLAAVGCGEVPVPLVLPGHRHDRTGAVGHQDVVGQEDGYGPACEGVHHTAAGGHTALVQRAGGGHAVNFAAVRHRGAEGVDISPPGLRGQLVDSGMFR